MQNNDLLREVARQALYRVAPDKWVERELGILPDPWQVELLRSPPGSQVIALTGRQAGKTQTAAWALAHVATFQKGIAVRRGLPKPAAIRRGDPAG